MELQNDIKCLYCKHLDREDLVFKLSCKAYPIEIPAKHIKLMEYVMANKTSMPETCNNNIGYEPNDEIEKIRNGEIEI